MLGTNPLRLSRRPANFGHTRQPNSGPSPQAKRSFRKDRRPMEATGHRASSRPGKSRKGKWVLRQLMAKDRLVRVRNNLTAFRGGFRLWGIDDVQTLDAHGLQPSASRLSRGEWRLL